MKAITLKDLRDLMIVRCKDCKHRPIEVGEYEPYEAPKGDLICPFICADDEHYNEMPPDDFFCAYGEKC